MALTHEKMKVIQEGAFIPAHPLAIFEDKTLDEYKQRRLTNYYLASGVDGLAVGVHTTQFEIRDPAYKMYEKVLRLAMEEVEKNNDNPQLLMIAGVAGETEQALQEAQIAKDLGYDLVLVSNGGLPHYSEDELLQRTKKIAEVIPVFGFYLQPAVGGRKLTLQFWRQFADIENVIAIKMAPFDRYETLNVVRAVCESTRCNEIALYTGNDDNIVLDLLTTYELVVNGKRVKKSIVGGLLGHWSVWTSKAVEQFKEIQRIRKEESIPKKWLQIAQQVTDANAAFFDSANDFKGSISGINEVLRRQGLLEGNWCLAEREQLSPGQIDEIIRVERDYPELEDNNFVAEFIKNYRQ